MLFKKTREEISLKPITHIAFIMDGNGRWAKSRGLPRSLGHKEGCKRIKETALLCLEFKIKVMSIFCFSTENWKRPKQEVDYLFSLLEQFFIKEIDELDEDGIKIRTMGDLTKLPFSTQTAIANAKERTKNNNKLILNIALNFGGQDEIIYGIKDIVKDIQEHKLNYEDINKQTLEEHMFSHDLPPVDLLMRTSGEQRLSNFMLWECAYAELVFIKKHWPDFKREEFIEVLEEYSRRNRRFGGLKNE